jgi:hypothetical protein
MAIDYNNCVDNLLSKENDSGRKVLSRDIPKSCSGYEMNQNKM